MTDQSKLPTVAQSLVVSEAVKACYRPLWPDLLRFYDGDTAKLDDAELMMALDMAFAERFDAAVCAPLGFFQGACVFIGMVLLRQSTPGGGGHDRGL